MLQVIAVAYAIITKGIAERPDFGYDLIGGHEIIFYVLSISATMKHSLRRTLVRSKQHAANRFLFMSMII